MANRKDFIPHVIVPITGGLGNQIWQYAVGFGIASFSGLPVKYDLMWFRDAGKDIAGKDNRNFDLLNTFPRLVLEEATEDEVRLYKKYFFYTLKYPCVYEENLYHDTLPRYINGFCAHARYLELLDKNFWERFEFRPLSIINQPMLRRIEAEGASVAVHVRRGDYVGSIHDVLDAGYYRRAMSRLKGMLTSIEPVFFIFSNDIAWAKREFADEADSLVFVDNNDNDSGAEDMQLMSRCRHHIISNSTFSWLAAWFCLKPDKTVLIPDEWFASSAPERMSRGSEEAFQVRGYIKLKTRI